VNLIGAIRGLHSSPAEGSWPRCALLMKWHGQKHHRKILEI